MTSSLRLLLGLCALAPGLALAQWYEVTPVVDSGNRVSFDRGYLAEDGSVTGVTTERTSFLWQGGNVEIIRGMEFGKRNAQGRILVKRHYEFEQAGWWQSGIFTPIGLERTTGNAIDDEGRIGGIQYSIGGGEWGRGFTSDGSQTQFLEGYSLVEVLDLNGSDQALVSTGTEMSIFRIWNRATGYSRLEMDVARQMNRLGHVIGSNYYSNVRFFDRVQTYDLGAGWGTALNDVGDLLVATRVSEFVGHPAVGRIDTGFVRLQDRLVNAEGWVLTSATSINNSGQILGHARLNGGQEVIVRLDPVPEPGTLAVLGLSSFALLRRTRHRRQP